MAKNIHQIAERLGAKIVTRMPEVGGGAFGAARLARLFEALQARLVPGQGKRAGRPSDANWVRHPKVPMSEATEQRLTRLAKEASTSGRKISPMQLAAQILEDAVTGLTDD
jgi:ribosomal protein S12 methylthiotransferase accessory factor YcaO